MRNLFNQGFAVLKGLLSSFLLLLFSFSAFAGSVVIPYQGIKKPANDLIYEGDVIDSDEAFDLEKSGFDTSLLAPSETDIYCLSCSPLKLQFPQNQPVKFFNYKPSVPGMLRFSVTADTVNGPKIFNVVASIDGHPAMLRHRLLTKLGYQLDPIEFAPKLEVKFSTMEERNTFLDNIADYTFKARERWIAELPKDEPRVVLQDLIFEPGRINLPQYQWGIMKADLIADRRPLRALLIPFVLADVGQSINLFSWDLGRVVSKQIILTHPYAEEFAEITLNDVKWITRKISKLTPGDWAEIAGSAHYPEDIAAIVKEKLMARRNEIMKLARLKGEFDEIKPIKKKLTVGSVKKGKVTQEDYPGYAGRFKFDDPQSPLRFSEVTRYLAIKGIGMASTQLFKYANDFINQDAQEAITKHKKDEFIKFLQHAKNHPNEPYAMPVKAYSAPYGGGSLNISRDVVTGTYYGSEYPVQLVDSFGVSANLGVFVGLDNLKSYFTPGASANVQVGRSYIHIRPLAGLKDALKENWAHVLVPFQMQHLTKVLTDNPTCLIDNKPCNENDLKNEYDGLKTFLSKMTTGEMFVVVDNLNLGGSLNVNVPILALLGVPLPQFSMGVSGGMSSVWMKRTTFERTATGMKVSIQYNDALSEELGVNFNFLLNLYSHKTSWKQGDAKTKFFDVSLNDLDPSAAQHAISSIRALFKVNSSELIERYYPFYYLKDEFKSRLHNNNLFLFQWDKMVFSHEIKIQPPLAPGQLFEPEKFERVLYHEKAVTRYGTNYFGFLTDILGLFTKGIFSGVTRPNENPMNRPFGKGHSFAVSTEAEVTENYDFKPLTIVEDVYGGWSIRMPHLNRIFNKLEEKIKNIPMPRKMINRNVFNDTKVLQQFEVRSTAIIYEKGNEIIQKIIFNKNELNTYNVLIHFFGGIDSFQAYCQQMIESGQGYVVGYHGDKDYQCVAPWMAEIMDLRLKGFPEVKTAEDKKKIIALYNKIHRILFKNAEWDKVLTMIGEENFLMLVKVAGFKKGDEGAVDEDNQTTEYVSDSLGEYNGLEGSGIFRDFMNQYGISSYQMNANFFSEGF
ncbi:MAG: hypothetical protein ACOYL6_11310 [Bacteriovoracaceae bacterium]